MPRASDPPILLVKWYELSKWLLARIESFPKSQRSARLGDTSSSGARGARRAGEAEGPPW